MGIILGIDIGGSTTKIAGLGEAGGIGFLQAKASDQVSSAYGAMGAFLQRGGISLDSVELIASTGVGAYRLLDNMYGVPVLKIGEFTAVASGGLELAGLREALIVSMGTGTAFVRAAPGEFRHIGGSGVGGGTITGLCSKLTRANHFSTIVSMSAEGRVSNTDLSIGDICGDSIATLPAELTAANFGNWKDEATEADSVAGVVNMVFETVGMLAVFAVRNDHIKDIVLTGSLTEIPRAGEVFSTIGRLNGLNFHIPENAVYATAIGAALIGAGKAGKSPGGPDG